MPSEATLPPPEQPHGDGDRQQTTQKARQMIEWARLPDARDEHQGSGRESGDEAEDTDEGEKVAE